MKKCAVCGMCLEKYVPIEQKYRKISRPETLNWEEYSCPYCYASDRDRLILAFIKRLNKDREYGPRLLEIAPSGALQRYLNRSWGRAELYTADLYMEDVTYQIDIQDMRQFADGAFDLIVCSHVLEHVRSDRQAVKEICRVLNQNGLAILLVPIDLDRTQTDEAWGLSEEENEKRFGQKDHVRSYSRQDFIKRLEAAGFRVFVLDEGYFTYQEFRENAFTQTSALYAACKKAGPYRDREHIADTFARLHKGMPIAQEFLQTEGACNYWLDVCEIKEDELYLWGWVYITGCSSRESKLKIMLQSRQENYLFGAEFRKRADIQEKFGQEAGMYLYSGIDFKMSMRGAADGTYEVWLLICNGQAKYRIDLRHKICWDGGSGNGGEKR